MGVTYDHSEGIGGGSRPYGVDPVAVPNEAPNNSRHIHASCPSSLFTWLPLSQPEPNRRGGIISSGTIFGCSKLNTPQVDAPLENSTRLRAQNSWRTCWKFQHLHQLLNWAIFF